MSEPRRRRRVRHAAAAGSEIADEAAEAAEPVDEPSPVERGLRGLVGGGSSQVSPTAALRARDAARARDEDLARAERGTRPSCAGTGRRATDRCLQDAPPNTFCSIGSPYRHAGGRLVGRAAGGVTGRGSDQRAEQVAVLVDAVQHLIGPQRAHRRAASTSAHVNGADTVGVAAARSEYGETVVFAAAFWLQSKKTLPGPQALGHLRGHQLRAARRSRSSATRLA